MTSKGGEEISGKGRKRKEGEGREEERISETL